MSDFAPGNYDDDKFLIGTRLAVASSDLDSDDEEDDEELRRANCCQRLLPRRRTRELILGIGGGAIVVGLLMAVVILSLTTRANRPTVVILVSLDGFALSYLTTPGFEHPNMDKIMERGVTAELQPQFPSLTFPNHWAMITGLYPESNGIIANRFRDPNTGRSFSYSDYTEATDPIWWKGEPFWTTVEKAGLKSATYFWPGSDVNGSHPTYWRKYDGSVPNDDRIKQVIEWLDMDWSTRPAFITLYISDVDTAGHKFGPDSEEVKRAVKKVDDDLGKLLLAIDNEGRQNRLLMDLVVVSDHGMAAISPNRTILLDQIIDISQVVVPDLGSAVASIWPKNDTFTESIIAQLQSGLRPYTVYRKKDIPEDFHYKNSDLIAPIIVVADLGWMITLSPYVNATPDAYTGGAHGFDPRLREMHGVLVAYGPHVKSPQNSAQIFGPIKNIEVHNLMACMMNVAPAPNNGTFPCVNGLLTDRVMRNARSRIDPSGNY